MKWIWTSIVSPTMLYACHTWAKRITERQRTILSKINRLALLGIAPVHRGTPTAGLEMSYSAGTKKCSLPESLRVSICGSFLLK